MAYASETYAANGVLETFVVPFPYLAKTDVYVELNGVATPFTWDNDSTVRVSPAPVLGLLVTVRRITDAATKAVDFTDGVVLTEAELDTLGSQLLNLIQEQRDDFDTLEAGNISGTTITNIINNTINGVLASATITTIQDDLSSVTSIADDKVVTYFDASKPHVGQVGDLWLDTDDANNLWRHCGNWNHYSNQVDKSIVIPGGSVKLYQDYLEWPGQLTFTGYPNSIDDPFTNPLSASRVECFGSVGYTRIRIWEIPEDLTGTLESNISLYVQLISGVVSKIEVSRSTGTPAEIINGSNLDSNWQRVNADVVSGKGAVGVGYAYYRGVMDIDVYHTSPVEIGLYGIQTSDGYGVKPLYSTTDTAGWLDVQDGAIQQALLDASTAQSTADGKIVTFYQAAPPVADGVGDLWVDTDDGNRLYRWDGANWVDVQDTSIQDALVAAANAQNTADGKITTFYQAAPPASGSVGDFWIDTDDGNNLWRWDGAQWVDIQDGAIGQALTNAATAQSTADGKIVTFYSPTPPTADGVGDLWIDTDDGNRLYRWSGSAWVDIQDTSIQQALTDAANAQSTADGKIETFYQATEPAGGSVGDFWIDTDDGNNLYRHNGTIWVDIQDAAIQQALTDAGTAQATADGKVVTFYQTTAPTADGVGDLWIDTDDNNKLYRWSGSTWVDVASTAPIGATVFHQPTAPTHPPAVAGDIWYDSDDNNKSYQSDGAAWQPLVTSINGALVVNGTIVGDHVAANTITAGKMDIIGGLSAITADLGTVTSGLFKTISGTGYRAELGEDGTYILWYGTGAKTDVNAKMYVKNDGTAMFAGTLLANNGSLNTIEFKDKLWMGTATYDTGIGFWAGFDAGTVKWYAGDKSTNQFIRWDGSTLRVSGEIWGKDYVDDQVAGAHGTGSHSYLVIQGAGSYRLDAYESPPGTWNGYAFTDPEADSPYRFVVARYGTLAAHTRLGSNQTGTSARIRHLRPDGIGGYTLVANYNMSSSGGSSVTIDTSIPNIEPYDEILWQVDCSAGSGDYTVIDLVGLWCGFPLREAQV